MPWQRNLYWLKVIKIYKDGSVYFIGFSSDDWKAIINYINEENRKSLDIRNEIISIQTKEINETKKIDY